MGRARLCSVSIDLDPIWCYTRIHDLPEAEGPDPIYAHGLRRFLELFDELGIRATFFVVASDVRNPEHAALLREAVAMGHELGNHSLDHPYNLPGLSHEEGRRQVVGGHEAILEGCGVSCVGFRAPGYNIDERTIGWLEELGYHYDSSVFPCPPYYLAKGAVMTAIRMRGGRSKSSMVAARTQLAPLRPYRPRRDAIHRRGQGDRGAALGELPMCVLPGVRWPVIGTSLIMGGPIGASAMVGAAAMAHRRHVNLELHGIDLVDADSDGVGVDLRARQPDLRRDLAYKLATFRAAFRVLEDRGYHFVPCREASSAFFRR